MSTIPYRAPQRPQRRATRSYDPADVIAYADQHGTAQAAQRFGIDERSVRRIRQKAEPKILTPSQIFEQGNPSNIGEIIPQSNGDLHTQRIAEATTPTFPDTADDRAGDSTYWKCPATGELMPVVPGTHRKEWERERHAAHARHIDSVRHGTQTPIDYVKDRTLDAGHEGLGTSFQRPEADMSGLADIQETEAGSQEAPGHVREDVAPVGPVLSGPVRERVITRIVRLPAETHQRGIYDRLANIDATSIMGPELGLIVAVILIAMTFWGLG